MFAAASLMVSTLPAMFVIILIINRPSTDV
jgi:hypothetical protein